MAASVAALAVPALNVAAQSAQSASYRPCALTGADARPPGGRPTYNLALKQIGTRCATAKKVVKAFHACRSETGVSCTRKVLTNWSCGGRKTSSIPTTFYASFTCKWGNRRVNGSYQQNTRGG